MSSQVTIYSPTGIPLADLDTGVWRSWVLNGYGEAGFTLSTKDNKCKEEYLRYGNILLVQHDSLPDWVGFMDTPRVWNYGNVECHALGAEVWFDWRVTLVRPILDTLDNVFRRILDDCNFWGGLQMKVGDIAESEIKDAVALGGKASDHINRMSEKYHVDWSVTHRINSRNVLSLYANLFNGLRGDRTNLTLNALNSKVTAPLLTEDGAIYNHVFYYSEPGEGGGRKVGDAQDEDSIARYGLRQLAEQGVGAYEEGLAFAAYRKLQETKEPDYIFVPSVLNVNDTFSQLRLGNVIYWDTEFSGFGSNTIGLNATLRIDGMEYDDNSDSVELVADVMRRYYTRKELINLATRYDG